MYNGIKYTNYDTCGPKYILQARSKVILSGVISFDEIKKNCISRWYRGRIFMIRGGTSQIHVPAFISYQEMNIQENTLFDIESGVKVTLNVAQYPLHHVTCAPAKFEVATSNG